MITNKNYICPVCLSESVHATNHNGGIYSGCRQCGNSVLYPENYFQTLESDGVEFIQAKIVFYDFNFDQKIEDKSNPIGFYFDEDHILNQEARTNYRLLREKLSGQGYKKFHVYTQYKCFDAMRRHNGEFVTIANPETFEGQYISNLGRIHNWYECAWPNKNIKSGYYLEF